MRTPLLAAFAVAFSITAASAQERAMCQTQEVVMYMTSWCAYCKQARDFMRARGVDFFEIDVERTDNEDVRRIGRLGVPQIATERGWIRGFNPAEIRQKLCIG